MMCQSIGFDPISTIGFGRTEVSSESLVPNPPASITTFMLSRSQRTGVIPEAYASSDLC